jgi:hypothetical protein
MDDHDNTHDCVVNNHAQFEHIVTCLVHVK